jgi:hypothetical protein
MAKKRERLIKAILRRLTEKKQSKEETSFATWQRKRKEFQEFCLRGYESSVGELANMIDGLTPDGFDKSGKKVSFVEEGRSLFERSRRLSEERVEKISG